MRGDINELRGVQCQLLGAPTCVRLGKFTGGVLCSGFTGEVMRVLVTEDEPGIAQFVCQGLREAGYAVDLAGNGEEGLDYALAAEYDVIVLDILLPRIIEQSLA